MGNAAKQCRLGLFQDSDLMTRQVAGTYMSTGFQVDALASCCAGGMVRGIGPASGTGRGVDGGKLDGRFPGIPTSLMVDEGVSPPQVIPTLSSPAVPTSHSSLEEPRSAWVVPVKGHLDGIERLMAEDQYIDRDCKQRSLKKSQFCIPFKVGVGEYSRVNAIRMFEQFLDRAHSASLL